MDNVLGLADVGGVLCVTHWSADSSKPIIRTAHWPSIARTADVLRYFEAESLDSLTVAESMPGEYKISERGRSWFSTLLALVDGSKTRSIRTTERAYDPPKRAKVKEYHDGRWHVVRGGRWVAV